jgi:hypothetical protein
MTLIQAIRRSDLRLQYLLTAQELAILAMRQSKAGIVVVSYSFLARKIHAGRPEAPCVRTAIRHVKKLTEWGIISKQVTRLRQGWYAWNTYRFLVPFETNAPSAYYGDKKGKRLNSSSDKESPNLPSPKTEEQTPLSLREEIRLQQKILRGLTPGSEPYEACAEEIARLEARLSLA